MTKTDFIEMALDEILAVLTEEQDPYTALIEIHRIAKSTQHQVDNYGATYDYQGAL